MSGVLRAWGLDPDLDALDLIVSAEGGVCWVAPGDIPSRAGATAADLARARGGRVADSLRECARTDGRVAVSCVMPHEIEWIGAWFTLPADDDRAETCRRRAVEYTRMTLAGMENRLVAGYVERSVDNGLQLRCLVRAESVTLTASLRDLRNDELPVS